MGSAHTGVRELGIGDGDRRRRKFRRAGSDPRHAAGRDRARQDRHEAVGSGPGQLPENTDGVDHPKTEDVRRILVARLHTG